jgi:DnaK suppressor protein
MSSTSILQLPIRHVPGGRQQRPSHVTSIADGRLGPGPRGSAQRRALLEARWRDALERITSLSIAYHDAAQLAPSGVPDSRGTRSRQARRLARQAVAERQRLAEIEAALGRITAGRYGWCEQCGRPIATARLAAQPQARYCGACDRDRPLVGFSSR